VQDLVARRLGRHISRHQRRPGLDLAAAAVWPHWVAVPHGVECQDERGRLWDVLWMLLLAIRGSDGGPEVRFSVYVRNDDRERTPLVSLKAACGPDDNGSPCITVMLPRRTDSQ
jgi:hypothetical protein